ncbi:MAG: RluA family pseudouridine synthase [Patescibacteria group bacterium]|jgi:23S rRNA pseudouridine1911/1915/1917 synthase
MTLKILYEDNHVIAVQKPHGMLVQSDGTADATLINEVRYFLKQRDNKPGSVFLGLVHRLDRPVGGVVVFGKTSKGAARLSEQFRVHSVEKVYWAVVQTLPLNKGESEGVVTQWLVKDEDRNVVKAFDHEALGSQFAETAWKVLYPVKDERFLVEVKPETGRPHQIRVALASLSMPIYGDMKYGSPSAIALPNGSTALALMARSLSFDQTVTKERITVVAEPQLECFYA